MIYDIFKQIAIDNDFVFEYSRTDYQNLYDGMAIDKVHFFVDPITIDSSFSESGYETKTYIGKFMLLVSSDIDEDYKDKFNNNIRPLTTNLTKIIKESILCSDYTINKFQAIEVINLFDHNLDGIIVNYSITIAQ